MLSKKHLQLNITAAIERDAKYSLFSNNWGPGMWTASSDCVSSMNGAFIFHLYRISKKKCDPERL